MRREDPARHRGAKPMTAPIEPATPIPTRRPRKPLRITLGALMILVLVIGGGLGWIAHRARVQHDAVAAIRAIKGGVFYNGQTRASKQAPDSGPEVRNGYAISWGPMPSTRSPSSVSGVSRPPARAATGSWYTSAASMG